MYYQSRNSRGNWRQVKRSPVKRIKTIDKVITKEERGALGGIGGVVLFGKGRHVVV